MSCRARDAALCQRKRGQLLVLICAGLHCGETDPIGRCESPWLGGWMGGGGEEGREGRSELRRGDESSGRWLGSRGKRRRKVGGWQEGVE